MSGRRSRMPLGRRLPGTASHPHTGRAAVRWVGTLTEKSGKSQYVHMRRAWSPTTPRRTAGQPASIIKKEEEGKRRTVRQVSG